MSIAMERFSSEGHFATYDPNRIRAPRIAMFCIQCANCGYDATRVGGTPMPPRICPKCHSGSWERVPMPGSILENAERD